MLLYSLALTVGLVVSAPWWLLRMATTERYREGLRQRLGAVPAALIAEVSGKQVVWLHAVSVGEVLAASRLVGELEAALGEGWMVVISTTTRTGQALARERFGVARVFYMPLDFAWAVRAYLRVLKPRAMVLMESELWPRMLHECSQGNVPVVVVNARVSDRSFARGMKLRVVWGRALRKVSLWLTQSEEDARRLVAMGASEAAVRVGGNLKYDVRAPKESRVAELIREVAAGRPIIVAGSTVEGEEELIIAAFYGIWGSVPSSLLVIAPRHPERFEKVRLMAEDFGAVTATQLMAGNAQEILRQTRKQENGGVTYESNSLVVVLNTIGDLASTYGTADVAFVGGSLVGSGGHNPLEPAQFGVPVIMGSSYENFREIVAKMMTAEAIRILSNEGYRPTKQKTDRDGLLAAERIGEMQEDTQEPVARLRRTFQEAVIGLLKDRDAARSMGERGRKVFEAQQGATQRAVEAIVGMVIR